ncbi:MAG: Sapep family Mn(2+)-dependent dipeptidase [Alphaproteobacteria bacterium]|jgi:succinyl-diaminopimelate desuccinylase|nr:Sapep family Mn(2+)-dependent dipeptidase [Alphaproteobacteria bacterium]
MSNDFEKIKLSVNSLKDELISSIIALCSVPSIQEPAQENAPFGLPVAKALQVALDIASKLGFKTYNKQYYGYATTTEDINQEYVGVFGHLDVVPANEIGWNSNPFEPIINNNTIYARGVLDNKSPTLATLYALKALLNSGIKLNKPVRIVFGCNEETGFACMEHYLKNEKIPISGFTPDCKYPVVYAERGRLKLQLTTSNSSLSSFFGFITDCFLQADKSGDRLGISCGDAEFGVLEMRDYRLESNHDGATFAWQISYPPLITAEKIIDSISKLLPPEIKLCILKNYNPVFFDKNSNTIQQLKNAYEEITGFDGTPVSTTGGTYAKIIPNIVPFGPSFAGQKGIAHNPNEYMAIDDIITNMHIYAIALYNLTR